MNQCKWRMNYICCLWFACIWLWHDLHAGKNIITPIVVIIKATHWKRKIGLLEAICNLTFVNSFWPMCCFDHSIQRRSQEAKQPTPSFAVNSARYCFQFFTILILKMKSALTRPLSIFGLSKRTTFSKISFFQWINASDDWIIYALLCYAWRV